MKIKSLIIVGLSALTLALTASLLPPRILAQATIPVARVILQFIDTNETPVLVSGELVTVGSGTNMLWAIGDSVTAGGVQAPVFPTLWDVLNAGARKTGRIPLSTSSSLDFGVLQVWNIAGLSIGPFSQPGTTPPFYSLDLATGAGDIFFATTDDGDTQNQLYIQSETGSDVQLYIIESDGSTNRIWDAGLLNAHASGSNLVLHIGNTDWTIVATHSP